MDLAFRCAEFRQGILEHPGVDQAGARAFRENGPATELKPATLIFHASHSAMPIMTTPIMFRGKARNGRIIAKKNEITANTTLSPIDGSFAAG